MSRVRSLMNYGGQSEEVSDFGRRLTSRRRYKGQTTVVSNGPEDF